MHPSPIHEPARAKVNLFLHVTGRRKDGYHTLDSLAVFADQADSLHVYPAPDSAPVDDAPPVTLDVIGPFAADTPKTADNLVLKAANIVWRCVAPQHRPTLRPARIVLTKRLPAASGIGGGSADAAAAMRALNRFWGLHLQCRDVISDAAKLGADIPMCLLSQPLRVGGIGDDMIPVPDCPPLYAVLVNPGTGLATKTVFKSLTDIGKSTTPEWPAGAPDSKRLNTFLETCRNDLQAPATAIVPDIARVIASIGARKQCRLARMSGSGATCFGLFETAEAARRAAAQIAAREPGWWVAATVLNS